MGFIKFSDWILAKESSPATRLRNASALGLMPPIPAASINSHSTAPAWQQKKLLNKSRPKKKRKGGKKKNEDAPQNKAIDAFVMSVEELEKDLEKLGKARKKLDGENPESKNKVQAQKNKEKESESKDKVRDDNDKEKDSDKVNGDVQSKDKSKKQSKKKA